MHTPLLPKLRHAFRLLSQTPITLALLGNPLFPADNPWNQNIANAPVAPNSTAVINNILSKTPNGKLHPDFGQASTTSPNTLFGIPYNVVHGNSTATTTFTIGNTRESDLLPVPLPTNPVLEGDNQNGPLAGLNNRGDSHLLVYDQDNNIDYELYNVSRPSENADGKWHADSEAVWNMNTDSFRTLGFTSADAAGLPILPGLIRPDEALPVSQGGLGVINHAIRFTLQNSIILDQFIYPASHVANPGNNNPAIEPPMGARFRLKASVDISTLDPQSQIIARAMQTYGLILADNGSNFFISGSSFSVNANNQDALTWNDNDIQSSTHGLKSLPFSDFEMVSLTPILTAISKPIAPANTLLTITGQNFSGAAGHLQVLFGNTPSLNVTILDDSHLTATIPASLTGPLDIRVQSGTPDPNDPQNITPNLFGYGTSATTPADLFTAALSGDANEDGVINLTDLSIVLNNFGAATSLWTNGNFDNAPTIDLTDLSNTLNNFGITYAGTSSQPTPLPTPEPATLSILALPFLHTLLRRR